MYSQASLNVPTRLYQWTYYSRVEVDSCILQFHLWDFFIRNEQWIHTWGSYEISATSVFLNLMWMSSKQFYPLKDFSIWPNTEELSWKIHCSLGMHKRRFDFDTGCCNSYRIHFSNIQFITAIFGWGTLDCSFSF